MNKSIESLRRYLGYLRDDLRCCKDDPVILGEITRDIKEVECAISVLESYPRWQPLIEAAKKVDREWALQALDSLVDYYGCNVPPAAVQIRSLIAALPESPDA